ncbi:zinc-binding dehydrogenase [Streptomyces sp. NBC_01754]|uniref:quinone oxidoreductase family protein n=1 Tax=Streptomyces sp. NBC_01754 TaxID=2975930 RepID=UPI002DD8865C|nr:zinc-binding dehydrogenase [Streptomyces sp. NBC_01754]WSC90845.1 zinc-binding dehydrogenase [Streptomyces sp. NBC_01754]WSC96660.1 zinc-binding dehydrogenase [Streptomyces sp. NBC_01754]
MIAAASSQDKLDFAVSLGADLTADYSQDDWDKKILAATGGKGVDVVLETVGGSVLARSVGLIAPFGRMVVYGTASGEVPAVEVADIFDNRTVMGFSMWGVMAHRPKALAEGAKELLELVASGKVRPVVHAELPLERAADAHALMEERSQLGRVVLVP